MRGGLTGWSLMPAPTPRGWLFRQKLVTSARPLSTRMVPTTLPAKAPAGGRRGAGGGALQRGAGSRRQGSRAGGHAE